MFGQQNRPTFGGFGGSTTPFGGQTTPQSQASKSLFGATTQSTGLFSTPTTNSSFGTKTPGGFGATTQQPSGGLFGSSSSSSTQNTSLFGSTATPQQTGGLFGGTTGTAGSGFGGTTQQSSGTTVKFAAPTGQDTMLKGGVSTNINTRHQCITAMKEYETKSLEELRSEDYAANRRGPQAGATTGSSTLFGSTSAPTTQQQSGFSLFGQSQQTQNKPTFGGFGGTSTSSTSGGGLFGGGTSQQSTGLFGGTTSQAKPLFGTTTTTTSSTTGFSGFGSNTTSSMFGQNNQAKTGLFNTGQTTQSTGLFSNPVSSSTAFSGFGTTGGFGTATQPQTGTGLFNTGQTTQSTGLFANPVSSTAFSGFGNTSSFGKTTQPTATGLFNTGQTTQSTGLFSNPVSSSTAFSGFGTTGGFGTATQPQTGGMFAKTGGFGAPATSAPSFNFGNSTQTQSSGMFGRPATSTTGFSFGQPNTGTFGGMGTGVNLGAAAPTLGSADNATAAAQHAQMTQQLLVLHNAPYGDNPLFRNLKQDDSKREELLKPTNPAAQKAALNTSAQYKVNSRPTSKIKPKPLHSIASGKAKLFEGLEEDEASTFGNETFQPRRSVKKLVIKSGNSNKSMNQSQLSLSRAGSEDMAPSPIVNTEKSMQQQNGIAEAEASPVVTAPAPLKTSTEKKVTPSEPEFADQVKSPPPLESTIIELNAKNKLRAALEESRFDSSGEQENLENFSERSSTPPPHPAGVVLRKPGYYILPSLEDMADCTEEDGSCIVENLVIGREGYGNVLFPGEVNVAGMNFDDIVHFRRKEITVYPDEEDKPEVGNGLNRRAQVTLDCVWPMDKTNHILIQDINRLKEMAYHERLERASSRIGAKFIDYRPETGSWVFEVRHFSKYGLVDSDDEDDKPIDPQKIKELKEKQQKLLAVQKQPIKLVEHQEKTKLPPPQFTRGGTIRLDDDDSSNDSDDRLGSQQVTSTVQDDASLKSGLQGYDLGGGRSETMMQDDSDMPDIMSQTMPDSPSGIDDVGEIDDTVPSSHRLAAGLGVQAHDLQIRKASFFGYDDEEMDSTEQMSKKKSVLRPGVSGFVKSPVQSVLSSSFRQPETAFSPHTSMRPLSRQTQQFSPNKPLSPFRASFLEHSKPGLSKGFPGMKEHMLIPSGLDDYEFPKKMPGSRTQRGVLSLKDSLLHEKEKCIADMGLFHSRSFRVGWGPHWSVIHTGKPILTSHSEDDDKQNISLFHTSFGTQPKRLDVSPFQLSIEKVHTDPQIVVADQLTLELMEKCLEIELQNSECCVDDICPIFTAKLGTQLLHEYANELQKQSNNFSEHLDKHCVEEMNKVFNLCVALWGNIPELLLDEETDKNSYHYSMARREALSLWLGQVSQVKIDDEVKKANAKGMGEASMVFAQMTGRRISESCRLAQEAGDHRLALLMAQAVGSAPIRQILKKQLCVWEETQADQFMEPVYLKLYTLLSGHMVWPASHMNVNVCDNLDWKRCLALHLWYHCPPQATISDALRFYREAFSGETKYAAPPLPRHLEDTGEPYDEFKIQDMCYHLLCLYSDRTHELNVLLNPCTTTPNSLDYRLSWHLAQILQSLEYENLSEYQHASLCCSYSSQLESMGLWQWAAFVLLHIHNDTQREGSVRDLLLRHLDIEASSEDEEKERFICERLRVPVQWLHEAKAIKAGMTGNRHEEAWHLLKACKWNESHSILLTHVASEAIINEHFDYLKSFLLELGSSDHCSSIQNWSVGGKVFLDYINMVQTIEQLKQGEPSAYELERLQPEVNSLAKRISHLQCNNAKDRLCQSEMAKRVANVIKTLMTMQHPEEETSVRLLAPLITQLPLPEDYALQELRQLTRSYMMEITMS